MFDAIKRLAHPFSPKVAMQVCLIQSRLQRTWKPVVSWGHNRVLFFQMILILDSVFVVPPLFAHTHQIHVTQKKKNVVPQNQVR